ncbi:hypothetical protein, variant [Verruconis gallopava]|uniref:Zn(2)-C6 fungal-type domain-containing protein n=1 Tax=Verruconis gallopava TaxID=253628 RepID=A0A0D2A7C6_9PEZI|nr:uncharacterized protein PV09_06086 [Verruconis gallopava]XP_016212517.1 hypothetical protein, variant [Verruconis gallopava]KIW02647.1 hypothetical protein PV09_06086 [Verruconis gallopava]KIW02648.1 hypothetical protein, variant [Verruconis gallopava]
MEGTPQPATAPAGTKGIAVMACDACRRLKMRCVGALNPPCERCAKAKRPCVISQRHRAHPVHGRGSSVLVFHDSAKHSSDESASNDTAHVHRREYLRPENSFISASERDCAIRSSTSSEESKNPSSLSKPAVDTTHNVEIHQPRQFALPSVYSVTPFVEADLESAYMNESCVERSSRSSHEARSSVSTSSPYGGSTQTDDGSLTALERDIYHLVDFFHSKMAMQTPVFLPDDFKDKRSMIRHRRPLAVCIAFVTARFVPGCRSLRIQLTPDVLNILKMAWDRINENEEEQRTLFQAFAILSTYASPSDAQTSESGAARYGELSPLALRSVIETFALRISLHRSWDQVSCLRFKSPSDALASVPFRRYLLWLWLYTMSHHGSLLMRTPPTIREDASIRSAPEILSSLKEEYLIKRILAEVELCLLWSQAGTRHHELGEWWVSPQTGGAIDSRLEALRALDAALVSWSERWGLVEKDDSVVLPINSLQRTSIDFHYRFKRFSVATYVTRFFHLSTIEQRSDQSRDQSPTPPTIMMIELLLQTMQAAMSLCTLPLELSPIQKDIARYIPHLAFAMLAFPCYFVMRAAEVPGIPIATVREYFIDIKRVADVFCEMAADEYHCASIYGKAILEELARTERSLQSKQSSTQFRNSQVRPHTPAQVHQNSMQPPSLDHTVYSATSDSTTQTDNMDFTPEASSMFNWQSLSALNSPNQYSGIGGIEGWFLNNFWDP